MLAWLQGYGVGGRVKTTARILQKRSCLSRWSAASMHKQANSLSSRQYLKRFTGFREPILKKWTPAATTNWSWQHDEYRSLLIFYLKDTLMTALLQILQALLNAGLLDMVLKLATNPIFAIMVVAVVPPLARAVQTQRRSKRWDKLAEMFTNIERHGSSWMFHTVLWPPWDKRPCFYQHLGYAITTTKRKE